MSVEYSVLGPLFVGFHGRSVLPSAPKPKQLLALFILNANSVVTTGICVEELWGDGPPSTAASTLQTYVLQIRKSLSDLPGIGSLEAARSILITKDYGYMLRVEPHAVDAFRFDGLVRAGEKAAAAGDDLKAVRLLNSSADIWRGDAVVDIQTGVALQTYVRGLEERRLGAIEQRIEAELRLGRHHQLIGELSSLSARYSLNENIFAQLMLALYRSGRQADALDRYRELQTRVRDELGLEPSLKIRRLRDAMLRGSEYLYETPTVAGGISLDLAYQSHDRR
ncbi:MULTISPECIES: AfsR/SARP family transcriptional regulator [Nocardia]|uniref:AfsR/SARP family transcriptional regulator n=1 Tax=Nocardia aurea TaxID=2144174 RepID=A0ABV3FR56_9NOCA|nr:MULTISPECIES: AfsR/SARP family transcriptional regulator [Nocardia]